MAKLIKNIAVMSLALFATHTLWAEPAAKKRSKAPKVEQTQAPQPMVFEPAAPKVETSGSTLPMNEGRMGLSFMFPDGGSPFGSGYVGMRYFIANDKSVGGYLLLSNDSGAKASAFGLAGKFQQYLLHRDRVHLFGFGQVTLGKNGGEANKDKDDLLIGLGFGGGVEYQLLQDLSFSYEAGLGYSTQPKSANTIATGSSKLALNIYF